MKLLDMLFENVFKKQEIVYSEKYWHEMQKLLEKKDRKALYFKRAQYVVLILLFIVSGFIVFNKIENKGNSISSYNNRIVGNKDNEVNDEINKVPKEIKDEVKFGKKNKRNAIKKFSNSDNPKWSNGMSEKVLKGKLKVSKGFAKDSVCQNSTLMALTEKEYGLLEFNEFENWGLEKQGFIKFKISNKEANYNGQINQILVKKKTKWITYLSPMLAINQSNLSQNRSDFLPLNKENEVFLKTLSVQFDLIVKKKNIVLGTGLGFISQQIRTNYTSEFNVMKFDTTLRLVNPNFGQTQKGTKIALLSEDVDTSIFKSQTVLNVDNNAVFNYVHVPVFARYEFSFNKLAFFIQTGMSADFLYRVQGNYLSKSNQEFKELDLNQSRDYKKQILSSQIALGLKCNISRKVNLVSMCSFQQTLTSMVKSYHQSINQSSFKIGLEVGLF